MKNSFLFLLSVLWLCPAAYADPAPVTAMEKVDLGLYTGRWFEIAKLPNSFQKDCAYNTQAVYTDIDDDEIRVENSCRTQDGHLKSAEGIAWTPNPEQTGILNVSFVPILKHFHLLSGNYWILDTDYVTYSLVGDPSREYLWILSRTPGLDAGTIEMLLDYAEAMGFDRDIMEFTRQQE